jgi:hypothetical protein
MVEEQLCCHWLSAMPTARRRFPHLVRDRATLGVKAVQHHGNELGVEWTLLGHTGAV